MKTQNRSYRCWKALVLLTFLLQLWVFGPSSWGQAEQGHGGDACDKRVDDIRRDLMHWILNGGAHHLDFTHTLPQIHPMDRYKFYERNMLRVLIEHATTVACIAATPKDPFPVRVNGEPKTCKSYKVSGGKNFIKCDFDRFYNKTLASDQYWLIHHEYAGIAHVEVNQGASSDYSISNQIVGFLESKTDRRLAILKRTPELDYEYLNDQPNVCKIGISDPVANTGDVVLYQGHLTGEALVSSNGNRPDLWYIYPGRAKILRQFAVPEDWWSGTFKVGALTTKLKEATKVCEQLKARKVCSACLNVMNPGL